MNKRTLTSLFALWAIGLSAQNITWSEDVAPILYQNCANCHRDGGLGHFSLVGYNAAYSNRDAIQYAVEARKMPPWKPDPTYSRFAHERRLSDSQIQTIRQWVEGGAPSGDLSKAPSEPVFNDASSVGVAPDQMLKTPFYTVTATDDEYRCFVIPNGLSQTSYLRGLEALPGNHEIVHHILVYEDATGKARQLDADTPEPGYVNFGGPGVQGARLVGAWVPGARTELLPPFLGVKLNAGADLIVQMHYPKGATGKSDQTTLNLFLTSNNQGIREVSLAPILNHTPLSLENYPLSIAPNEVKTYHARFRIQQNASLIGAGPHMHLIGRNIVSFGVTPQGDTIRFIRINDWDFHWQGSYTFQKVKKIPAGTMLHAYATYDNTPDNPFQPVSPPQPVEQGEATTDEMMLVYFAYMAYQPGDENIVLDSTLLTSSIVTAPTTAGLGNMKVSPNPLQTPDAQIEINLEEKTTLQVSLCNPDGRTLRVLTEQQTVQPGLWQNTYDLGDLPAGVYFVKASTGSGGTKTVKLVKF